MARRISENVWGQRSELPKTCFTGPGHDAKPWTTNNRVLLCLATLSIGLYLLLEGTFRRCGFTPPLQMLNIYPAPTSTGVRQTHTTRCSPLPCLDDGGVGDVRIGAGFYQAIWLSLTDAMLGERLGEERV